MSLVDDNRIISLVAQGRTDAFGDLVERYQKPVFRLAVSILGSRDDAEDAAQEVFIRAYKSLGGYSGAGSFWAWLRKITINLCIKKIRPVKTTSLEEIDEVPGHDGDVVLRSAIGSWESAELRKTISQLPPAYRSVIVLRYLEDMTYAEIAETLGETLSNVQVRIHRAKKMLRERVKVSAR